MSHEKLQEIALANETLAQKLGIHPSKIAKVAAQSAADKRAKKKQKAKGGDGDDDGGDDNSSNSSWSYISSVHSSALDDDPEVVEAGEGLDLEDTAQVR